MESSFCFLQAMWWPIIQVYWGGVRLYTVHESYMVLQYEYSMSSAPSAKLISTLVAFFLAIAISQRVEITFDPVLYFPRFVDP